MTERLLKADPGTYALLLRAEGAATIDVGALGEVGVRPGVYVYVGSAFGPGGLRARVERHIRDDGATHWHIDYLRRDTELERVWYTHDSERRECAWGDIVQSLTGATTPIDRFGASDCPCRTHLARFETRPSFSVFVDVLSDRHPRHAPVGQLDLADSESPGPVDKPD